ncbi:ferredoxin family protein [Escherichia coli]|uniref:ferredoxin family protein n=1 Tax=Escherichia coli TaxID=562 RepID=UPI0004523E24|nr:ferredoxin [Escherichia coli O157:H7 str. K1845]
MSQNATVNVDIKLGVNKFHVDEGHPHIILAANPDINEFRKLMKACPAGLYKQDDAGNIHFDSAGCLECGTCRVLSSASSCKFCALRLLSRFSRLVEEGITE